MLRAAVVCSVLALSTIAFAQNAPLSRADTAGGWKSLFDGKSTDSWRGYKKPSFPDKGWVVEDGCIKCVEKGGGGDIVTKDQYGDFEFEFEFKVSPKGNSGVIYRVIEKGDATWQSGPEYQVLDDAGHGKQPTDWQSTGAMYELYPPASAKAVRPAGEWNTGKVRIQNNVVQHWLNGVKIVEATWGSPDWKEKIAASKFKGSEAFGAQPRGHIALQDHGNDVWYRNLRVRDLSAPLPKEVSLFNGKDLSGLSASLDGGAKKEDVWSAKDGVLICKGNPIGYIHTDKDYKNFVLKLEWRWNPETKKTGNSGVLVRVQPPHKNWPRSVEAQLQHDNAGDFWNIDEFPMKTDAARLNGRNTKRTHGAERPVGEWNEYEIVVDGPTVILRVNGEELNRATEVAELAGKIALQSEGCEIHFRNVRLAPMD